MYKIICIEDHELTRVGIVSTVEKMPEATIVAEGEFADDISKYVQAYLPDLILLDIQLKYVDGSRANILREIRNIHELSPSTKILIISAFLEPEVIHAVFNSNVDGYLVKDDVNSKRLPGLIIQTMNGVKLISPQVQARFEDQKKSSAPELTQRKIEVLISLAKYSHLSYKEIANKLGIEEQSFKNHVGLIYGLFGVSNRTSCVLRGMEYGYIRAQQWSDYP